ncbi:fibronectin type III domain-containing protein [Streptomyces pathocidini]|uniref:fibronectin type III domain-containing protein n=1 Tax=Streptomyces pathocidini TaxID=1650571 RepID=UPI0033C2064B
MRRTPGLVAVACAGLLLLTGCGGSGRAAEGPSAPIGVTVQAGSATSVHVMWSRPLAGGEVAEYEIYRRGAQGGSTEARAAKVEEVPGTRYMTDVTGLKPSTAYVFTVRARDAAGNLSGPSQETPVTLPAPAAADRRAPTAPRTLRARPGGARAATLTWGASTDDQGVVSYDIYQGGVRIHSVGGGETTALLTGLRPGRRYTFTVKARDAADHSSPASPAARLTTAKDRGSDAGTAPADLRVTTHAEGGSHHLDLSWVPPRTGGEVTAYEIHLDGRFATTLSWGAAPPKGRAAYSFFVGEKAGRTYAVKLRARLPDGTWGAFSEERTVTTGAGR